MGSKAIIPVFRDMVLIEILPHILVQRDKTLFSDGNAAEQLEKTNLYGNIDKFDLLHWEEINEGKWTIETDSQRIMCSEVLVPDKIETFYMQRMILQDDTALKNLMQKFPNQYGIELIIDPSYFDIPPLN